jgi:hypothetical protein
MRFLREALIAAMLLGCGEDNSDPAQPQVEGMGSSPLQSSSGVSGAARAADDDKGHKGPKGQTRGFFVSGIPGGGAINIGTDFTEIQKFSSLPPGSYIANASAVLASNGPDLRLVDCGFTVGGTLQGELARGMVGGAPNNFVSLPLTVGFTIETTTDLGVACRSDVSPAVVSQPSPITAIRVDRLTIQP